MIRLGGGGFQAFRRLAALTLATVAASVARAQGTVSLGLPLENDSIPAAPLITTTSTGLPAEFGPFNTSIEISSSPAFFPLLFSDSRDGTSASFRLTRPLPEKTLIFVRVRVVDRFGTIRAQAPAQGVTRAWVRLVSPKGGLNVSLETRRPLFVWSSASVTLPPGPWQYDLSVVSTTTQQVLYSATGLTDTVFVPAEPLEANASLRWRIRAYLPTGDESTAISGTFTITSRDVPLATLFYPNFPNPFPTATSATTCFWFDLATAASVTLKIYSIRGHPVRTIVPGQLPGDLALGAYGRSSGSTTAGCDPRLEWGGTDDRGRTVPQGIYIAILTANGKTIRTYKMVFLGR